MCPSRWTASTGAWSAAVCVNRGSKFGRARLRSLPRRCPVVRWPTPMPSRPGNDRREAAPPTGAGRKSWSMRSARSGEAGATTMRPAAAPQVVDLAAGRKPLCGLRGADGLARVIPRSCLCIPRSIADPGRRRPIAIPATPVAAVARPGPQRSRRCQNRMHVSQRRVLRAVSSTQSVRKSMDVLPDGSLSARQGGSSGTWERDTTSTQ